MNNRTNTHGITRMGRPAESGVALLTVLALLSIFAVILAGFTYSIRMEENTIRQYADSVTVQESTEAAIQGVLAQLAHDMDPSKPNSVLGRPQPRYTSLLDPWSYGYAGTIGKNLSYDARSKQLDVRPQKVFNRTNLRFLPTPIPRGVDEDPPGDVTGMQGIMRRGQGDGAPGLKNVDDDLDGVVDNGEPFDDDEDGRVDEDDLDRRRDGLYFAPGTGYDADGDRLGVFDECAKININFAGNNFGRGNKQTYNSGVYPTELDLPVFLFNRVVRYANSQGNITNFNANGAEQLANAIVSFRYGSVMDHGRTPGKRPGVDNQDDNGNNDPQIVKIQSYSNAFNDISQFDGEPYAIVGNGVDDDGDSLYNEEDEHYIGPSTQSVGGSPLTKAFGQDNVEYYRPGDKIDNNGDGYIDEENEGIDEPSEFDIFRPKGDDRPYTSVDDLRLVEPMTGRDPSPKLFPTLYDILSDSVTIYSQSDEISGPLSALNNEVARINPNLTSNWLATDIWNLGNPIGNRADFQYSPKVKLEDLFALQVDNDGDWQLDAEVDVTDGKDNDGDGLVDEPSDDWDGNRYPSGDFDGFGEADVGAPAFAIGGDHDNDQMTQDKIRSGGNDVYQGLRMLGWADEDGAGNKLTADNFDSRRVDLVTYDEKFTDIIPGLVVEGNGVDDDGDLLIDDTGDFNGDGLFSFDPEWHVSEDAWGDLNGDGYPGLGADIRADQSTREGRIVKAPDNRDALVKTSLADDDFDGYADFYDPQVLAAMYAPEWDGVDNDNDGEIDEIGERYIACFDDDEDGRMDEDPPEFQLALNLVDFIDAWMPFPVAEDVDVRKLLGKSQDDPVLADPVTFRTITLYSTRQRAFRIHPRILAGPNSTANDRQLFAEQMRLMLPNPPQTGMPVKFQGVESIRINEVMPKPVIRLEAEEVLQSIQYNHTNPSNPYPYTITYKADRFEVKGNNDDGLNPYVNRYDTNWGAVASSADGSQAPVSIPAYTYLPGGFRNTYNPFLPFVNMDILAPAFIFAVTNVAPPAQTQTTKVGTNPNEEATWVFENIPAGYYDVVLYLHPSHRYRPEVNYYFNGKRITFRSDTAFGDANTFVGEDFTDPLLSELIRRDTAMLPSKQSFRLNYRLTPYDRDKKIPDRYRLSPDQRVVVGGDGELEVRIVATEPVGGAGSGAYYETSFDRIELISPWVQYVELENISTEDIDLSGWMVDTPYGHYLIPEGTIIGRMKPSFEGDDGRDLPPNKGMPGNGVPFEPLLSKSKVRNPGTPIASLDLLLEDNKLLLANHKEALSAFIRNNYPDVPNLDRRIVEPILAPREMALVQRSLANKLNPKGSGELANAQQSDLRFRLVDVQEDILSHNPDDKYVTLSDPSGHYIDSFQYRTTFNNVIVNIPTNPAAGDGNQLDLLVLPGYRGMESFERSDTTHFETKMVTDRLTGRVSGERSVPSSIMLKAQDAILLNLDASKNFERLQIGGYVNSNQGVENDRRNPRLRLQRFADRNTYPANDSHWNGWDFIGDYYEYPSDMADSRRLELLERSQSVAREAVAPSGFAKVRFFDMLGGFENAEDVRLTQQIRYTAFVWRMGLRELIRAGYDPDVDDQLTVRVLGRKAINHQGEFGNVDLPVGEVMVIPTFRILDPGSEPLDRNPKLFESNPANKYYDVYRSNTVQVPVFAKLRNGDTAFTIDLRKQFSQLNSDLKSNSDVEPEIEIMVVMRKSTRDHSYGNTATLNPQNRPDLLSQGTLVPDEDGNYRILVQNRLEYIGNLGDDNYFFRGIELYGRGRRGSDDSENSNARRTLLAGTPGRDNTGYVPAYPRRRLDLTGKQRDQWDIIDNTAYIKNGPLATVGELSRLFTGNRFETVNTPFIPQRLEDLASVVSSRVYTTPDLGKRAVGNNPDFQKALAQRERLDQWENQYLQLFNMITTSVTGIRPGLINVNTASREVLSALPFCPPKGAGDLETLQVRYDFNNLCADYILEGRQPGGHDMYFGIHDLDDDDFLTRVGKYRTLVDTLADFKLPSVGREYVAYKKLDDIESNRFDRMNLTIQNIEKNKGTNLQNSVFLSTEVSEPDDGPYADIGTLLMQITHLKRRDRLAEMVMRSYDRTFDKKVNEPGDLRERINASTYGRNTPLTPEDMEAMMNRISNLITVRSRAFSIVTRGRIFDHDGNLTAQRKLETVYQR